MNNNKGTIGLLIFVICIMIFGSFAYFLFVKPEPYMITMKPLKDDSIIESMQVLLTFTPDGIAKLFLTADTTVLSSYTLSEGAFFSQSYDVLLGSTEAQMMREEKLIGKVPTNFDGFFGKNVTFVGIIKPTKTLLDEMHFVQSNHFTVIRNREGISMPVQSITVYLSPDKYLKLFAPFSANNDLDGFSLVLNEGNLTNYVAYHNGTAINGKTYYPLIIGAIEADMMRSEYLFSNVGDTIDDLFGTNYIIVGIVAKNNSAIDMMHFAPAEALKQ